MCCPNKTAGQAGPLTNWWQIVLACVANNFASGFAFGSFGTLVLALEQEFHASRATSSLALSLMVLSLSSTAALLGKLVEHISLRPVMVAGAVLGAAAFALTSIADSAWQLLAIHFLLLGPAVAMFGALPANTSGARWATDHQRGVALGLINMPLLVMVVPLALAPLLEAAGIRMVYRTMAAALLLLAPLLLLVRDKVPAEGLATHPKLPSLSEGPQAPLTRSPIFWLLVVAQGLLVGAGTMKLAHFVPLLIEQGRTFNEANTLLALSGGAGLAGSFLFGALADRLGGAKSLMVNCLVQAAMWTVFLAPVGLTVLVLDAIIVGACGAGAQAAFGVIVTALYGARSFSRAFGLFSFFTLPFLFGLTPLMSLLYQSSGSYHLPMGLMVGGFLLAAGLFALTIGPEHRAATRRKANTIRRV